MRYCRKCQETKEDNKFYTYYHSVQKKYRTRHICNQCMNKQKLEYKKKLQKEPPKPEVIEEKPFVVEVQLDHQYCNDCEQWLPKDDFYPRLKIRCKKCELHKDSLERAQKRAEAGGSVRVRVKPNDYEDDVQKEQTFEFMRILGYTFNEEKGIWYKLPWKDKDGNFPLLDTYGKTRVVKQRRKKEEITQQERDMVIKLYVEGYTCREIKKITGTPLGTLWRWVEKHKSESET